jgi:hypothetical protein
MSHLLPQIKFEAVSMHNFSKEYLPNSLKLRYKPQPFRIFIILSIGALACLALVLIF